MRKSIRKSRSPKRVSKLPKSPKAKRSPKKVTKKSIKKSIRKSRKCQQLVSKKIGINMKEYKEGRYVSPAQAIAVAYNQVKKRHPECEKFLRQ